MDCCSQSGLLGWSQGCGEWFQNPVGFYPFASHVLEVLWDQMVLCLLDEASCGRQPALLTFPKAQIGCAESVHKIAGDLCLICHILLCSRVTWVELLS